MRRWLLIFAVALAAAVGLRSVHAQNSTPAASCDPTTAINDIHNLLGVADNDATQLAELAQAKAIIDNQLAACKAVGITPAAPDTPTPPEGVTPTATSTLSAIAAQGATRTAVFAGRTATASAKQATATFMAQYKPIDIRELVNYADNHAGEDVIVSGTIFNIDGDIIQIYGNGNFQYAVFVQLRDTPSGIYTNDYVTVYGTVTGFYSFQNTQGNEIRQPRLTNAFIKK